jgi:hypothetical protein
LIADVEVGAARTILSSGYPPPKARDGPSLSA